MSARLEEAATWVVGIPVVAGRPHGRGDGVAADLDGGRDLVLAVVPEPCLQAGHAAGVPGRGTADVGDDNEGTRQQGHLHQRRWGRRRRRFTGAIAAHDQFPVRVMPGPDPWCGRHGHARRSRRSENRARVLAPLIPAADSRGHPVIGEGQHGIQARLAGGAQVLFVDTGCAGDGAASTHTGHQSPSLNACHGSTLRPPRARAP